MQIVIEKFPYTGITMYGAPDATYVFRVRIDSPPIPGNTTKASNDVTSTFYTSWSGVTTYINGLSEPA